ncbi:polysaccharide deacetylase family protein [Flavobacteriaceae bacterium]|nr:polysaccharide deacetylase family protein [Flavobacteriaceae bacterium]
MKRKEFIEPIPLYKQLLPELPEKSLSIFLFHDVCDDPSQFAIDYNLAVSNKLFQKQIRWIDSNYSIISPEKLLYKKEIPKNAAIITFDDGFLGTFQNGISYLELMQIPSIVFLNMSHIENNTPMISAVGCFLENKNLIHADTLMKFNLKKPFHLNITPQIYNKIIQELPELNFEEINRYQGQFATSTTLRKFENSDFVFYGNHLYQHWNAASLKLDKFVSQYKDNRIKLSNYKNSIDFFSFPNGQPRLCFSSIHLEKLTELGCKSIFYSSGTKKLNFNKNIYDRMDLTTYEYSKIKLLYRVLIRSTNQIFIKRFLNILRRFL